MTTPEALHHLGVRDNTLSPAEKSQLDREGYLVLGHLLDPEEVAERKACLERLAAQEGDLAGTETHQERGSIRLSDLVNKSPLFDLVFTHPRVLAAVAHILENDLRLSSINSRAALPGEGGQHLHADWDDGPLPGGRYQVCNTIWLLDDFTESNGPTRFVPGTHRSGAGPRSEMADPGAPHPREVRLLAPAGTVVVWNGHLWHGGTRNETGRPRLAFHGYFCRREVPQQTDQRRYLRPESAARLSAAALHILDV